MSTMQNHGLFPSGSGLESRLSPITTFSVENAQLGAIAEPVLNDGIFDAGMQRFINQPSLFPAGTNEAIGLRIVEAYLDNNPDATASLLIRVSPDEIYDGSNYSP